MAKIHEEILIVKISKLVRNDQDVAATVSEELVNNLQAVIDELVGDAAVVEIEQA